ncbi:peptidylprolyl isomerase [Candidatus Woesearchaeota archaeon]|nr:peptidylprolyl isomerase [Candidatus Woesearchaeota archaeon]
MINMVKKVKKGDFIQIDFIAKVKGSNQIFDVTNADLAKKEGAYQENRTYKPLVVCLGAGHLLKGVDKQLTGKEIGKEYEFNVSPEQGFGHRNPKHIKLTSLTQFKKKGINPIPGQRLAIDGAVASIRSVTGGRVIIDFNHPLAGRTLHYKIKINKKVTDTKEKISGIISLLTKLEDSDYTITISDKEIKINLKKEMPENMRELVKKQVEDLVSEAKSKKVVFTGLDKKNKPKSESKKKK